MWWTMSIRSLSAVTLALAMAREAATQQQPRGDDVTFAVAVAKYIRSEFSPGAMIQFAEALQPSAMSGPNGGRHSARLLREVNRETGIPTIRSVDDASRKCEPDAKRPGTSSVVCVFRDTRAVFGLGSPEFRGDTAEVRVAIWQNHPRPGVGITSRRVQFTGVWERGQWRILKPRVVGPIS